MTLAEKMTLRALAHRLRSTARDTQKRASRRTMAPDVREFVANQIEECQRLAVLAIDIAEGRQPESRIAEVYVRVGQLSWSVAGKRAELKGKLEAAVGL